MFTRRLDWKRRNSQINQVSILSSYHANHTPESFWADAKNRRQFFDDFASKHKFDPLNAENWKAVSKKTVLQEQVSTFSLSLWNGLLFV